VRRLRPFEVFDSTLRDGAQAEGISFSVRDKLNIARALDAFGVDYIEAGNPGSNPKDIEFFEKMRGVPLQHAKLCAFGSTRRKGIKVEDDANVVSLLAADTPAVAIFGKSWLLHVREILGATDEENLALVYDTIAFFKARGREVIFDAEHFFDGYFDNAEYALQVLDAAKRGGADVLCLCDTNGGTMPSDIISTVAAVAARFPDTRIGIHCHDDAGCAVANTILAVEAGAAHVQGTFIGYGERCGNADLSVVIPDLMLKKGYPSPGVDLTALKPTAARVAEISNVSIRKSKPFTGASAFAHKGGMHVDGVLKLPRSFEHIEPERVGNARRFLASEVSGRSTVIEKVKAYAPDLRKNSPEIARIIESLKDLEHQGYQFEAADASFELLVRRLLGRFTPHFSLVLYRTTGESPAPDGEMPCSAMVCVNVDGREETTAAMGNGPVNALDLAIRKALSVFYPQLADMWLTDYKVRVLEADSATAARVRVLIESTDGARVWTTVGVSTDIIEASWRALVDSIEYKLTRDEEGRACACQA
jgi:2-isopropylmalate synthase